MLAYKENVGNDISSNCERMHMLRARPKAEAEKALLWSGNQMRLSLRREIGNVEDSTYLDWGD